MRTAIALGLLMFLQTPAALARPPIAQDADAMVADLEVLRQLDLGGAAGSRPDTVWFGGSGTGNGTVVRGGLWTWEADSGEPPEFFADGDPVGNQYRDGWTFEDRTARTGPPQVGSPHWRRDGSYDFEVKDGGYAHRHSFHPHPGNPPADSGPDPLSEPGIGGSWSVWIGTNLYLNPEICGWGQVAGYGDGWSQGITKVYTIPRGTPPGTEYGIRFYHRYAVEFDIDTAWVEISFDGRYWEAVGTEGMPQGIYNGGERGSALPGPNGGLEEVDLLVWPGNPAADEELHVRFRIASDGFTSDASEGGDFFWAWQLDNIQLLRDGLPAEAMATFELGMDGWEAASFEGFDFDLTTTMRPAGRIEAIGNLACPPLVTCPDACGIEGRVLLFADRDECDLNDSYQESYATSPAFAIGGPANPDIDDLAGRGISFDWYRDGGAGLFNTGPAIAWVHWPFDENQCPYTPGPGEPGAGATFNWSQTDRDVTAFFNQYAPDCDNGLFLDVSYFVPPSADSVIVHVGVWSSCRTAVDCDPNDNGAPFYDNIRFGVYDPAGVVLFSDTTDRYSDNFPIENGPITTTPARSDCGHSLTQSMGIERPPRWVRSDSVATRTPAPDASVHLRFAIERGHCQPNLDHPFFLAYPPSPPGSFPQGLIWHEARMDTARAHQTQEPLRGAYMSCYHPEDPLEGTHWTGQPPSVEPCDDVIADGLLTAGTNVYYFFEARDVDSGGVLGTFPMGRGFSPIGTDPIYRDLWLQMNNLPELDPACDGTYAHNMLVVQSYQTDGVPGRGTSQRERLTTTLASLGLEFDVYDDQGAGGINSGSTYNGIGRREDRMGQQPRPPYNGATEAMLEPYDCIWHTTGLQPFETLSDKTTLSFFGGQPSQDQQTLETWLANCTLGHNRLLVLDGIGWASDIDINTAHGPAFLAGLGVDVLARDYAQELANNDLRRCARLTGTFAAPTFEGAVFGSGCPDDLSIDVLAATGEGVAVASFVESFEGWDDPVDCTDDENRPQWHAVVRRQGPLERRCEHSVAMSFAFAHLYPLNCVDECLFDDFVINGKNAELVIDLFQWAGKPINPEPIGVRAGNAPRPVNALYGSLPNPANPSAVIRYTIAEKGRVTLQIFDVSGRLVRTLIDEVQEPTREAYEVTWDGRDDAGRRVSSGVYFYELEAPGYTSSRKLTILK